MIGLRSPLGTVVFGAVVFATGLATSPAASQLPEDQPEAHGDRASEEPSMLQFDGCVGRLDLEEVRARVALELVDQRARASVHVHMLCTSSEATVTVTEAGRPRAELAVDLGDTEGTARAWALALVVSDLLRQSSGDHAAPTPEAPTTARVPPRRPQHAAPGERTSRHLASPIAPPVARATPTDDERPPDHSDTPPRPAPSTWLGLGTAGRITLDGPTAAAGLSLSIRHHWFRAGLTVFGTHRGDALGQVAAGLLLLDVAVLPVRHQDGTFSLAGEIFAHGGAIYGAGIPASSSIDATDTAAALIGFGLGARVFVDGPVGVELGLRGGYEVLGTELRAAALPLMRFYGLFASLDLALSVPLG